MSNFKVSDADKEKLGSLALVIKEQTEIFLLDNDAFINKGNKQAAKLGSKPKSRKSSQTIQSGIDESTHAANSLRILTLFLIGKTPSFNYEGVFSKYVILFLYNHIFNQSNSSERTVTSSSYFSRSIVQII
jgi:hypothetical protein